MESKNEISSISSKMRDLFNLNEEEKKTFILNLIAISSFVVYVIGIYLHIAILGNDWGNVAVDLSLRVLGPIFGLFLVVLIGLIILLFSFFIQRLRVINIYLCWFWIISLFQCSINSFLQFYSLPDEPINLFFKILFPEFWYPIKEIVFIILSIILTYFWIKKIHHLETDKIDIVLISLVSAIMIIGTLSSQIFLIN